MNPAIIRIKEAAPLPVIASEYVSLRKSGAQHLTACLWHQDKNPSLRIYADHYFCFVCQSHGDVVDFVARAANVSKGRAIALLSERTGISLDPQAPRPTPRQRRYDADEQAFAEWWWERQREKLARRTSVLNEYYASLDDAEEGDVFWQAAERAGVLSRQVSALDRIGRRVLAERCATAEDRQDWQERKDFERRILQWARDDAAKLDAVISIYAEALEAIYSAA